MKANNTLKRLSALLLAGSITVLTASAADSTTSATAKAKAPAKHQPAGARITHAIENSFEFFPNRHEPVGAAQGTLGTDEAAGLDRDFDAETGHAQANPIFGFRW